MLVFKSLICVIVIFFSTWAFAQSSFPVPNPKPTRSDPNWRFPPQVREPESDRSTDQYVPVTLTHAGIEATADVFAGFYSAMVPSTACEGNWVWYFMAYLHFQRINFGDPPLSQEELEKQMKIAANGMLAPGLIETWKGMGFTLEGDYEDAVNKFFQSISAQLCAQPCFATIDFRDQPGPLAEPAEVIPNFPRNPTSFKIFAKRSFKGKCVERRR